MSALHDLTIKAIRRAQSMGGVVDPIADFQAISELDKLARSASEVTPEDRLLFMDLPLVIGNAKLYRLSWGASDWLTQLAMKWFRDDLDMMDRAIAWAHVNARNPGAFKRFSDSLTARKEIGAWSRELTAPVDSVMAAIEQLYPRTKPDSSAQGKSSSVKSNGPVLDLLMDAYKQPIDYFLWEISAEALEVVFQALLLKDEMRERNKIAEMGLAPSPDSRSSKAIVAFQRASREFVDCVVQRSRKDT